MKEFGEVEIFLNDFKVSAPDVTPIFFRVGVLIVIALVFSCVWCLVVLVFGFYV